MCWTAGHLAVITSALEFLVTSILQVLSRVRIQAQHNLNCQMHGHFNDTFVVSALSKMTDRLTVWDEDPDSIDDFTATVEEQIAVKDYSVQSWTKALEKIRTLLPWLRTGTGW